MPRVALIARMDNSGLGAQTLNIAKILKPWKIMLIDSSSFNGREQHPEWYSEFSNKSIVRGFPSNLECSAFLNGAEVLVTCEIPYSYHMFSVTRRRGIRSYLMFNPEFLDYWRDLLPLPTKFLSPSHWYLEEVRAKFSNTSYLPPPTFASDFQEARNVNTTRKAAKVRFLHIAGTPAMHDRAGTDIVIEALKHTKSNFELIIRAQNDIPGLKTDDKRVKYMIEDMPRQSDLYSGADAVLHPRRYGGLNLVMNEALMCALPVLMSNCSPNNAILPGEWLADGNVTDVFRTRRVIDIFTTDAQALAAKMDWYVGLSGKERAVEKARAFEIGYNNFSDTALRPKYVELIEHNRVSE